MKKATYFFWKLDQYKTEYLPDKGKTLGNFRYCIHEWLWNVKEYGFTFKSLFAWIKNFYLMKKSA